MDSVTSLLIIVVLCAIWHELSGFREDFDKTVHPLSEGEQREDDLFHPM